MLFSWYTIILLSVGSLISGLNRSNLQLLQRLGLTLNSHHEENSIRKPLMARRYQPNSSPIYTIRLPPSSSFYHPHYLHNHLTHPPLPYTHQLHLKRQQEVPSDPDQMLMVPMKFPGNGRPHSVYHYRNPTSFGKKALLTPLIKSSRFRKRTSKLDSQDALRQKFKEQALHSKWAVRKKSQSSKKIRESIVIKSEQQKQQHPKELFEKTIIHIEPLKHQRLHTKIHSIKSQKSKSTKPVKCCKKRTRKVSDSILHYNYLGNGRPGRVYLLKTSPNLT